MLNGSSCFNKDAIYKTIVVKMLNNLFIYFQGCAIKKNAYGWKWLIAENEIFENGLRLINQRDFGVK